MQIANIESQQQQQQCRFLCERYDLCCRVKGGQSGQGDTRAYYNSPPSAVAYIYGRVLEWVPDRIPSYPPMFLAQMVTTGHVDRLPVMSHGRRLMHIKYRARLDVRTCYNPS